MSELSMILKIFPSIVVKIIQHFRNRPYLQISANIEKKQGTVICIMYSRKNFNRNGEILDTSYDAIKVRVVNVSQHKTMVDSLYIILNGSTQSIKIDDVNLKLSEGDDAKEFISLTDLFQWENEYKTKGIKSIYFIDSLGKDWEVSKKDLKKVNKELNEYRTEFQNQHN